MAFYGERFQQPDEEDILQELKYWLENPITESERAERDKEINNYIDVIIEKATVYVYSIGNTIYNGTVNYTKLAVSGFQKEVEFAYEISLGNCKDVGTHKVRVIVNDAQADSIIIANDEVDYTINPSELIIEYTDIVVKNDDNSPYVFDTTKLIVPLLIIPLFSASIRAWRFVPPPDTKTAILAFSIGLRPHRT